MTVKEICHACQQRLEKTRKLNIFISETQSEDLLRQIQSSEQAYVKGYSSFFLFLELVILK